MKTTTLLLPTLLILASLSLRNLPAEESADASTEAAWAADANLRFGLDLYRQIAAEKDGQNVFFSPYSLSVALAMATEGARGETARELGQLLGLPSKLRNEGDSNQPWRLSALRVGHQSIARRLAGEDPEVLQAKRAEIAALEKELKTLAAELEQLRRKKAWKEYHATAGRERDRVERLNQLLSSVDRYELSLANAFWGAEGYPFNSAYLATLDRSYASSLFSVDFAVDPEAARRRINRWVEDRTSSRISDLLPEGSIQPLTRLVLTNAIYFKGEWDSPFEVRNTGPREFTLASGETVRVPTMKQLAMRRVRYGAFRGDGSRFETPRKIREGQTDGLYPDDDGFQVLEVPYKGNELSMVVLVPGSSSGLAALEKRLGPQSLGEWIHSLERRGTHVHLPKLKMESSFDLVEALERLGARSAFDSEHADFSGMLSSGNERPLYLGRVVHKAFVQIDEKGAEAAAATALDVPEAAEPPEQWVPFTPTFRADRPYIFLIRERSTGTVLFFGRVTDPRG